METLSGLIDFFPLIFFLVLLTVGYIVGRILEKKHYSSIIDRENQQRDILLIASKKPTDQFTNQQLVMGNVVISSDYFKTFSAGIRGIFGGRLHAYETLVDRGRREAILRMKNQAEHIGANAIFNVKLETSTISTGQNKALGTIEILAYGTAGNFSQ